jgi:hypothetical protein
MAVARKGVAEGRALCRAHLAALLMVAHVPRAQERASSTIGGLGAVREVTTQRG